MLFSHSQPKFSGKYFSPKTDNTVVIGSQNKGVKKLTLDFRYPASNTRDRLHLKQAEKFY